MTGNSNSRWIFDSISKIQAILDNNSHFSHSVKRSDDSFKGPKTNLRKGQSNLFYQHWQKIRWRFFTPLSVLVPRKPLAKRSWWPLTLWELRQQPITHQEGGLPTAERWGENRWLLLRPRFDTTKASRHSAPQRRMNLNKPENVFSAWPQNFYWVKKEIFGYKYCFFTRILIVLWIHPWDF